MNQADDYLVTVTLTDEAKQTATDSNTIISLQGDPQVKNVLVSAVDASVPGRGLSTQFVRTYRIRSGYDGVLGRRWTHSYNLLLTEHPDGRIRIREGVGSNSWYARRDDGTYESRAYDYTVLSTEADGGYKRINKNGTYETFDPQGRFVGLADSNGNTMTFEYDDDGLLTTITDPLGHVTELSYENERIVSVTDPAAANTKYEYDEDGNLASVTDALGNRTSYTYDEHNNLVHEADPTGRQTHFEYDPEQRLTAEYNDGGVNKLTYSYSATEPKVTVTDALGNQTLLEYNDSNDLIAMTDALGNTTRFHYDDAHNLTRLVDASGHRTESTYDDGGNLLSSEDALGNITRFTYEDTYGKVESITDSLGRTTTYAYDARGNLAEAAYPDGSSERYKYDRSGHVAAKTDRKGQTIEYSNSSIGQLTTKTFPDGSRVTYEYDAAGNPTTITGANGSIAFAYDTLGRATQASNSDGMSIKYQYDGAGSLVQLTYPDGTVLKRVYDKAGRLTRIEDGTGNVIVAYTFDLSGRRVRRELENGTYTIYTYNAGGRLTNLVNENSSGEVLSSFAYTYDAVGNRLTMVTTEGTHNYSYDATGQLIGVTSSPGSSDVTYNYDALGNRTSVVDDAGTTDYETNNLNQYTSVGGVSYTYDPNGNIANDGRNTYEYDAENRLVKVNTPTEMIEYTYDALGRRISKSTSSGTTNYINDGFRVILEVDDSGLTEASYIYGMGIDEVLVMSRDGTDYFYGMDGLGSVTHLTDESQNVVESFTYDAYGTPSRASSVGNPYLFTGREFEPQIGLYYYRERYYSPDIGRFISADPSGFFGGLNFYSYGLNNPVILVDPTGRTSLIPAAFYWVYVWATNISHWCAQNCSDLGTIVELAGRIWDELQSNLPWWLDHPEIYPFVGERLQEELQRTLDPNDSIGLTRTIIENLIDEIISSDPTFVQPSPSMAVPHGDGRVANGRTATLTAEITVPYTRALVRGSIPVFGLAHGEDFEEYRLEYGDGHEPKQWTTIAVSSTPRTRGNLPAELLDAGDTTIVGNLGNWDTGLKNYVYMPTYPPDHPVDLNGVYTLRLVVVGKDEQTVEDRVTVEVGRVIPNAWGGTAQSRNRRVVLTVPEQAIRNSFRVISVKPLDGPAPPIPAGHRLVGTVYQFREPGESFSKDATLEMRYSLEEVTGIPLDRLGIYGYEPASGTWRHLATQRNEAERTLIAAITEFPAEIVHFAILASDSGTGSTVYERPSATPARQQALHGQDILVRDTFEDGTGEWSNRDRDVGATVSIDNALSLDGTRALRITNVNEGGNFAATALASPFDAREYPIIQFEYRISPGVKTDLYMKVSGRWYNVEFTDDPKVFDYKRVNIANVGRIPDALADNRWHTAEFNIAQMLATKTGNYIVEEIIFADWDVPGFMRLTYGHNPAGASFLVDNFTIRRGPGVSLDNQLNESSALIEDFESRDGLNILGGDMRTLSDGDASVDAGYDDNGAEGSLGAYRVSYGGSIGDLFTYAGWATALRGIDASEARALSFNVRGLTGGERPNIYLDDGTSRAYVDIEDYAPLTREWQTVSVPLARFSEQGVDLTHLKEFQVVFEWERMEGTVYIDDVGFEISD